MIPVIKGGFKILSFDIENRPLSYWIPDRPTADITAIAWGWVGSRKIRFAGLGQDDQAVMLQAFVRDYNKADMVTGHYIRKHDLPIINGALIELGLPMLTEKMTQDTKLDLVRWKDIPASQEYLLDMLAIADRKVTMSQADWREANRLTPEGVALTKKRVVSDVRQHQKMRAALLERGLLKGPKVWRP